MKFLLITGAASAFLVGLASPALAQRPGEVTLYSNPNFSGRQFTVTGQRNILNTGFTVRSVRMATGEQWQLCERPNLMRCTTINGSVRALAMDVESARPALRPPILPPVNKPWPPSAAAPSLRGMAAEFFPRPEGRRGRVETAGNSAAAKRTADDYCRQAGWTRSAHERLESMGGRVYLADVLCVRGM